MQLLLEKGANINLRCDDDSTALHAACRNKRESTVNILLNNEAAVNILRSSDHTSPLYLACENGHESSAKLLLVLDNGADRNLKTTNGLSSLAIAYQNGNNGIQKLFQNI